jgi:cytochrome c peroxidase
MRRAVLLFVLPGLLAVGLLIWKHSGADDRPTSESFTSLRAAYLAGLDSLEVALDELSGLRSPPDVHRTRLAFRQARTAYKRIEYLVEFEDDFRAIALSMEEGNVYGLMLNGAPIPIVDEYEADSVIAPSGFQVIEAALFPVPAEGFPEIARREAEQMRQVIRLMRAEPPETLEANRRTLDAARLEVARVATLGIAGFDATQSGDALLESAEALRGVRDGLAAYEPWMRKRDPPGWDSLASHLSAAIAHLEGAGDFDAFDRLNFLTGFVNPITRGLHRLERALDPAPTQFPGAWALGATNIYAAGALNSRWFAPDYSPPSTPALVALGSRLFFDHALSRQGNRSCATCHIPDRAFTDGRSVALVDPGHGSVRNTPTLINAGLQVFQFADQRVRFLEFQVEDVMQNEREMALPVEMAARRLSTDTALSAEFGAVFGRPRRAAVTGRGIAIALAAFVRSLEAMNSRFDRAVRGEGTLNDSERRGFNLFMGKGKCATCHFPPLFGGTVPPSFLEAEPEVIGVPAKKDSRSPTVDPDLGVFGMSGAPPHRHGFKTPSLRNVEVTPPYMHNGVFTTLEEVVDFYNAGGGNGLGMRLPNQTLPADSLRLTEQERSDLIAFQMALTDTVTAAGRR